jgi:hypothetical protein
VKPIVSIIALALVVSACTRGAPDSGSARISNERVEGHSFLQCMDDEEFYPRGLVEKGRQILLRDYLRALKTRCRRMKRLCMS